MTEPKHLTIVQMNDTHAYLELHPELFFEAGGVRYRQAGGFARIASLFNQVRKENPNGILALDNGDTFHGTYPAVATSGEALLSIVNALDLDGMTAHWEFAYGPQQFERLTTMLHYPMLANNCYREGTHELVFPSYAVVERAGLKIGMIGIAAPIVDKMMPPHFSAGIYFTLGHDELPMLIKQLREERQVDLIVVLSYVGFPQEVKLAGEVDGIDILLSGHTHHRLTEPVVVNDTLIMQSGCHGSFIGRLDLEMNGGQIQNYRHELMEVTKDITPDPDVQHLVDTAVQPYRVTLDTVIGETKTILNRNAQLETTMDNLLLQALLDVSGAKLAFSNGWRYGAPVLEGPVTVKDLWHIIPTNPPVSTVTITGQELLDMLEENLENTFANDPYEQMGGYVKRCLGMKMFVKLENPLHMRIQSLFIGNEPVDKQKIYFAAFVTVQGVPKNYGENRQNLEIHAVDALRQYIEKESPVSAELRGTIQVI